MTQTTNPAGLDALTGEGFRAIAAAFGEEAAWQARIKRLEAMVEETRDFRWFSRRWERRLADARFELDWLRMGASATTDVTATDVAASMDEELSVAEWQQVRETYEAYPADPYAPVVREG